jgi:RNA polymerase sigma-70 factor (ECF subfamily)
MIHLLLFLTDVCMSDSTLSKTVQQDKELVISAQADKTQFTALYNKYRAKIFNYFFYRLGHNEEAAEEMTQETFLKAFKSLSSFVFQDYSYFSYLSRIAHNLLVNYYRSPHEVPTDMIEDTRTVEITDVIEKMDAETCWKDIAKNFTTSERKAMLLFYYRNLPVKTIAEKMHKTPNAVKLLLSHARKKVRTNTDNNLSK